MFNKLYNEKIITLVKRINKLNHFIKMGIKLVQYSVNRKV